MAHSSGLVLGPYGYLSDDSSRARQAGRRDHSNGVALSSLYAYLCNENGVEHNPVAGVKRPAADNNDGTPQAPSDARAKSLLRAPKGDVRRAAGDEEPH